MPARRPHFPAPLALGVAVGPRSAKKTWAEERGVAARPWCLGSSRALPTVPLHSRRLKAEDSQTRKEAGTATPRNPEPPWIDGPPTQDHPQCT